MNQTPFPFQTPINSGGNITGPTWITFFNTIAQRGSIKARAYRDTAFSAVNGFSKIQINAVVYDPSGIVDITSNNRITPTLPGFYQINAAAACTPVPSGQGIACAAYINGTNYCQGTFAYNGASGTQDSSLAEMRYFNGSTDYLELWVYNSYLSSIPLVLGPSETYISILGPF